MSEKTDRPKEPPATEAETIKKIVSKVSRKRGAKGQAETGASTATNYCCTTVISDS